MKLHPPFARRSGQFLLALILAVSFRVHAQPIAQRIVSLESRVASASEVTVGTISNCAQPVVIHPGPFNDFQYTFTLSVKETIKGRPCRTLVCTAHDGNNSATNRINQWIADQTPFLFFVDATDRLAAAIQLDPRPMSPEWLNREGVAHCFYGPSAEFMDGTILTNAPEILARARAAARQRPVATNDLLLGTFDQMEVPLTPAFEKVARRMALTNETNPGIFPLIPADQWVHALRSFRSARNIRFLKSLLQDPRYWDDTGANWDPKRKYFVRQAAGDVLQAWGVKFDPPVAEEHLPWHFDPAPRQPLGVHVPGFLEIGPPWRPGDWPTMIVYPEPVDRFGKSIGPPGKWDNFLTGSNLVFGMAWEWWVRPDGGPRPSQPASRTQDRLDIRDDPYPAPGKLPGPWSEGGLPHYRFGYRPPGSSGPVPGQKYDVEVIRTIFETDQPPPGDFNQWQPEKGRYYRVLSRYSLTNTFGPY